MLPRRDLWTIAHEHQRVFPEWQGCVESAVIVLRAQMMAAVNMENKEFTKATVDAALSFPGADSRFLEDLVSVCEVNNPSN